MSADLVPVVVGPVKEMPYPTEQDRDLRLPGVIVKEVAGARFIGFTMTNEQGALLSAAQEGVHSGDRPLTHDLLCGLIEALGAALERITISGEDGKAVFAELTLRTAAGSVVTVDSRPSDALIIGARLQVPVFAKETVLGAA